MKAERKVIGRKRKAAARQGYLSYARDDFSTENVALDASRLDRIEHADSSSYLKTLPDNCIDLIFTSPPYNFGLDYGGDDDASRWDSYFSSLSLILFECVRILKHGGRLAINVQPLFSDYIPTHHEVSRLLMGMGLIWRGEILWEKNNYNCKYTAWGSWKSPSSPYLKYTWEFIEVFSKGSLKKSGSSADADISADEFKKWVYAKWSVSPEREMSSFGHPAMFPLELARRTLLMFSYRGDVVLDPFAGVGTTCLAAKLNGRRYLGVDVSEAYCVAARRRLSEAESS